MRQSWWGSALIVPLAALSFACGGASFTSDNDAGGNGDGRTGSSSGGSGSSSGGGSGSSSGGGSGSSSGGSGSGGSSGGASSGCSGGCVDSGPTSRCPAVEPGAKSACAPQDLECEYGSNPVQGCDSISTCKQTWEDQAPTDSNCSAIGTGCPPTFDAVPQGSACPSNGLVCNYPRSRCACVHSFGGPVMLVDASTPGRWVCQDPSSAACPMPRAPLGSACAQSGLSCDYGSCSIPGGTAQQCEDGIWKPSVVACPQ